MEVAIAMSGGVDSSVAAALLVEQGHDVTGVTLRLWGGPSDSGCCAATDVDDARRVAQQLGIAHHVVNLSEEFMAAVVTPYIEGHAAGKTPNPCIECNRHIKFSLMLDQCRRLGFDRLATGHHARIVERTVAPTRRLARGADPLKDQSYVLSMLPASTIAALELPVGEMTKAQVRDHAVRLGLRTATKPDSQDVCFIPSTSGRDGFLSTRLELRSGRVIDQPTGQALGTVAAIQLVTLGQRRGIGAGPDGTRRYVVDVDLNTNTVTVAPLDGAMASAIRLDAAMLTTTSDELPCGPVIVQVSAHGRPAPGVISDDRSTVTLDTPARLVAPGQTLAFYDPADPDVVLGSAVVA